LSFSRPELTQREDGGIAAFSDTHLSGEGIVSDIHANADFAMGRWAAGVVTSKWGTWTLAESSGRSFHYVMVNSLAALPSSGTTTCDEGVFTRPTEARLGPIGERLGPGLASGTAKLVFGSEGAVFDVTISATRGTQSGQAQFKRTIPSATSSLLVGSIPGTGAWITLGRGAGDKYLLVGDYAIDSGKGASGFTGAFMFRCG
jgi:hypothetical protein